LLLPGEFFERGELDHNIRGDPDAVGWKKISNQGNDQKQREKCKKNVIGFHPVAFCAFQSPKYSIYTG
jgi:hypothetical protein